MDRDWGAGKPRPLWVHRLEAGATRNPPNLPFVKGEGFFHPHPEPPSYQGEEFKIPPNPPF